MVATSAQGASVDPESFAIEDASGKTVKLFSSNQLRTEFKTVTITTTTPWSTDGAKIQWRGPPLLDLLHSGGLDTLSSVQIVAYDDFISDITLDEIRSYGPILALERSCTRADVTKGKCQAGQQFRAIDLDEKGPHFIVWPLDKLPSSYVPARNSIWVFFPVAARPSPQ
ncbi:MAG: hypothetical protein M9924_21985 [Rhizobiaceae bacterium]|nr:hypothetical protein [Rhizobiaceae bacterium]